MLDWLRRRRHSRQREQAYAEQSHKLAEMELSYKTYLMDARLSTATYYEKMRGSLYR